MHKLQCAGIIVGTMALSTTMLGASAAVGAHRAMDSSIMGASYSFTSISSPSDTTFTQLAVQYLHLSRCAGSHIDRSQRYQQARLAGGVLH
jgi:hypothetical protein